MKKIILFTVLVCSSFLAMSQYSPVWKKRFDEAPTAAIQKPVKTMFDNFGNILVVTNYELVTPSGTINKIKLYKYDLLGALQMFADYDNGGTGNPYAMDMTIDPQDNIYITGRIRDTTGNKPLLVKFSTAGAELWTLDTFNNVPNGIFNKVIWQNNKVFVSGDGLAVCIDNGQEIWSRLLDISDMEIDNTDAIFVSTYDAQNNFIKYNSNGSISFSVTAIPGCKLAHDGNHQNYLLSDQPYELKKYDDAGNFVWQYNGFNISPGFGDIAYDVLTDFDNNVYAIGLQDSMFKFDPNGNLLYRKSMNGLDNYLISAKIYSTNILFIAGTINGVSGYDQGVAAFDMFGRQIWSGSYNATTQQEFVVSMAPGTGGVYVLADSAQNSILTKYTSPLSLTPDYNLVCVDSVWYDPQNPNLINVSIFNANSSHLNYPSVVILGELGDTISNRGNFVDYFAHLGNTFMTYTDTITVQGITDWSGYTFVISELFGDTSGTIGFCDLTGIEENDLTTLTLFPNPATDQFTIHGFPPGKYTIHMMTNLGQLLQTTKVENTERLTLNVNGYASGIYFISISNGKTMRHYKLIKD